MQATWLQFSYNEELSLPAGEVLLRERQTQKRIYVLRRGSVEDHPLTAMFVAKMLAARLTDATNIQALLQRKQRELKRAVEEHKPM